MRREHDDNYSEEASVDDDEDVNMKGDDSKVAKVSELKRSMRMRIGSD